MPSAASGPEEAEEEAGAANFEKLSRPRASTSRVALLRARFFDIRAKLALREPGFPVISVIPTQTCLDSG